MKFRGWSGEQMHLALARLTEKTGTRFRFTNGDVKVGCREVRAHNTRIVPNEPSRLGRRVGESYPAGVLVRYNPFREHWRRVAAACYHAHGHFMRALFDMNPDGVIRTAMATYKGVDGFNALAYIAGMVNKGSVMYPVQYRECCDCYEHGTDRF